MDTDGGSSAAASGGGGYFETMGGGAGDTGGDILDQGAGISLTAGSGGSGYGSTGTSVVWSTAKEDQARVPSFTDLSLAEESTRAISSAGGLEPIASAASAALIDPSPGPADASARVVSAGAAGGGKWLRDGELSAVSPSIGRTAASPGGAAAARAATSPAVPEGVSGETRGGGGGGGRSSPLHSRFCGKRSVITADSKTNEIFAHPLATEGAGSVFPVDLPMNRSTDTRYGLCPATSLVPTRPSVRRGWEFTALSLVVPGVLSCYLPLGLAAAAAATPWWCCCRRIFEIGFIKQFDRLAINPNVGEFWMLIDAHWVSRWVAFVLGQAGPPGPISNDRLYREDAFAPTAAAAAAPQSVAYDVAFRREAPGPIRVGPTLSKTKFKADLQAISDYRAIHPVVWYIFREIYTTDGTPDICRWKLDLYAEEVSAMRRARILEPNHIKAIYQLRRFVARIKHIVAQEKEMKERQASHEREIIEERQRLRSDYRHHQAWRSSKGFDIRHKHDTPGTDI
ncbi:conserved unknown protein [Ectocarpus siliculosus]|uniref:DUSP domain-containing protein n=1 Tax=Ectocarpus siliculosus TaxID=2880 RepID=D7FUK6_ECTSI|nr:conserved unknown protein [Ectocarpus siliculosus]|eukprot:CBJ31662.1 conserved unknown protein [Ectocarpus siliculosus]